MRALVAGISGFFIAYLFDWASLKRIPGGKQVVILFVVALLLATRSTVLLICAPVWVFMDVIHVLVQDRFFFPRMFPDYHRYQGQTPMLIPTRESIGACLKTLRAREA